MKKHLNIRVYGKVQGVFFRASAHTHAQMLDINGFAQNEKDKSVYIEAEGESAELNQFIEWCHRGPDRAKVLKVEVKEAEMKFFKTFEVKRGVQ